MTTAVIIAAVAVVVSFIGASQTVVGGQSWFDVDYVSSMQTWFPMLVLLATLLFLRTPDIAAEWLIGAGTAAVGVGYVPALVFRCYQIIAYDSSAGWASLVLRTAAAIATIVAVVIAWRSGAAHEGGPIRGVAAILVVVGAGIVFFSTQRATDAWYSSGLYGPIIFLATIGVLVVLLLRVFRRRQGTNAGPALVAAGLIGVGVWGLEVRTAYQHDIGDRSADIWMAVGYAVFGAVGAWRWITDRRAVQQEASLEV